MKAEDSHSVNISDNSERFTRIASVNFKNCRLIYSPVDFNM